MECNRDEAMRAKSIAEAKLEQRDFFSAKKFALKAQNLYPGLDGISQLLMTLDVYISAENKINGETDWYGVLAVSPSADENTIKKQFRRLALLLHPDKNRSIGADGAFKLISEAWKLLLDEERRLAYNQRRGIIGFQQRIPAHNGSAPSTHTGCAPSAPCTSGAPSAPRTSGAPSAHTGGAPSPHSGFRPSVYTGASPSASTGSHPPAQPGVGPSARTAGRPPAHTSVPPAYTSGPSAYPSGSSAPPGARTAVPKEPSRPAPTPFYKNNSDTFWTICNLCNMQYEYLRMYLNNILRCPSCKKPFMALQMAQPRFSKKCKPVPYQAEKKPSENSTTPEDPAPSVASRGPTFVVISQLPRDKKRRSRPAPTSDPCPKKAKELGRVGGVLAMSRAFGNRMLKQFVVAEPKIQDQEVVDQDFELLVLASDGLWDVVPTQDAVLIAQTEEDPEGAARKLTETAFSRGSADNITCIVVKFHHDKADPEEPPPSPPQENLEVKPESDETQENDKADSPPPEECQQTSKEEPHITQQS